MVAQKNLFTPLDVSSFTVPEERFLKLFNFEHAKLTQTQITSTIATHISKKAICHFKMDVGKIGILIHFDIIATVSSASLTKENFQ